MDVSKGYNTMNLRATILRSLNDKIPTGRILFGYISSPMNSF